MIVDKVVEVLRGDKRILFAYLFGSFVRNKDYANDIDIAVFVKGRIPIGYERRLALKIEKNVKMPVDVVVLNDKPLLLIMEVLRTGKLIFSRDERARVKFETRMLPLIFDFDELMKEYDRKRLERYGAR